MKDTIISFLCNTFRSGLIVAFSHLYILANMIIKVIIFIIYSLVTSSDIHRITFSTGNQLATLMCYRLADFFAGRFDYCIKFGFTLLAGFLIIWHISISGNTPASWSIWMFTKMSSISRQVVVIIVFGFFWWVPHIVIQGIGKGCQDGQRLKIFLEKELSFFHDSFLDTTLNFYNILLKIGAIKIIVFKRIIIGNYPKYIVYWNGHQWWLY